MPLHVVWLPISQPPDHQRAVRRLGLTRAGRPNERVVSDCRRDAIGPDGRHRASWDGSRRSSPAGDDIGRRVPALAGR